MFACEINFGKAVLNHELFLCFVLSAAMGRWTTTGLDKGEFLKHLCAMTILTPHMCFVVPE